MRKRRGLTNFDCFPFYGQKGQEKFIRQTSVTSRPYIFSYSKLLRNSNYPATLTSLWLYGPRFSFFFFFFFLFSAPSRASRKFLSRYESFPAARSSSNVFKLWKDASSTNNGTSRRGRPPTLSSELPIERESRFWLLSKAISNSASNSSEFASIGDRTVRRTRFRRNSFDTVFFSFAGNRSVSFQFVHRRSGRNVEFDPRLGSSTRRQNVSFDSIDAAARNACTKLGKYYCETTLVVAVYW